MYNINLYAAWLGIFIGFLAGAIQGLFFYSEDWLGGYASWPRRMLRLGHISFFGIAFINISFVFTSFILEIKEANAWPSRLFVVGAVTMPLCCYLSAFEKRFRHLFFIPVISLIAGAAVFVFGALLQ
jgi:hypothetical protein